jgi:hypothetical protein
MFYMGYGKAESSEQNCYEYSPNLMYSEFLRECNFDFSLARHRLRCENNIKMGLRSRLYSCVLYSFGSE